jgi:hypothetical protein
MTWPLRGRCVRAREGYKDPLRLTRWVIRAAVATAATGLVFTIGLWRHPFPEDEAALDSIHLLLGLATLAYLAVMLVGIVLGLAWTFRMAWNARHLGAKGFDASPAMSVGWYFVPLANLVMPYRAMRQIYSASLDPEGWNEDSRAVVAIWWWLILLSGVPSRIGSLVGEAINGFDVAAMALLSASAAAFVVMAKRVASAQLAHRARVVVGEDPALS